MRRLAIVALSIIGLLSQASLAQAGETVNRQLFNGWHSCINDLPVVFQNSGQQIVTLPVSEVAVAGTGQTRSPGFDVNITVPLPGLYAFEASVPVGAVTLQRQVLITSTNTLTVVSTAEYNFATDLHRSVTSWTALVPPEHVPGGNDYLTFSFCFYGSLPATPTATKTATTPTPVVPELPPMVLFGSGLLLLGGLGARYRRRR